MSKQVITILLSFSLSFFSKYLVQELRFARSLIIGSTKLVQADVKFFL